MLSQAELKIVISTLTARRSWLRKTLDDPKLDPGQRDEHLEATRLIDSSLKNLARMADSNTAKTPAPPPTGSKKRPSINVLVAEDNEDSALLLTELLADLGLRDVDIAKDGMEAFDKIKSAQDPYNLILCDWDMPGLTGLEVYNKAKASNRLRGAHFMMVTAVSEAARIREAIQVGINDYLVKPIDTEILESKVRAAMGELMPPKEKAG